MYKNDLFYLLKAYSTDYYRINAFADELTHDHELWTYSFNI